jgi:hypothetical protein
MTEKGRLMTEARSIYRGHEIVTGGTDEAPKVSIDGQEFPVSRIGPGRYSTLILPQAGFTSVDAVGRALADHLHQFRQPGTSR